MAPADCVCMPDPGGGFAMIPRSEFTERELEEIDFVKKEWGL
jgi:hypothetical protein